MPAIIKPEFNNINLFDIFIIFLYFKINAIVNIKTAAIQNGIATLVKKSNGMPATVNPRIVSTEIRVKHALWQT